MKDIGPTVKILGMNIPRDQKSATLKIKQPKYLKKIVKRFKLDQVKTVNVPLAEHFKLSKAHSPKSDNEREEMKNIPYSSVVGSLMYGMTCTRPDIAFAMCVVSRYMSDLGKPHWEAVKWILRYIKGS